MCHTSMCGACWMLWMALSSLRAWAMLQGEPGFSTMASGQLVGTTAAGVSSHVHHYCLCASFTVMLCLCHVDDMVLRNCPDRRHAQRSSVPGGWGLQRLVHSELGSWPVG
jgi:hypothetical protein